VLLDPVRGRTTATLERHLAWAEEVATFLDLVMRETSGEDAATAVPMLPELRAHLAELQAMHSAGES
jgi:hypothetical protein